MKLLHFVMVTYIMEHPVYVPHLRLLSASFHTFVVINWLINYPQADNNRDMGASEGTRTPCFWQAVIVYSLHV